MEKRRHTETTLTREEEEVKEKERTDEVGEGPAGV